MEKVIEIDKELCEKIERLHYEHNALQSLIMSYIESHREDEDDGALDNPVFKSYNDRMVDKYAEYEKAKDEMVKQYGIEGLPWTLDFKTGEVAIG